MSDNAQQPPGDQDPPRDPWAPPERKVPLEKPQAPTGSPVHDQQTVSAMPGVPEAGQGPQGPGPGQGPGQPQPGAVPPPPTGPNGPGQPQSPAGYGYPSYPSAPQAPGAYPGSGYPGYPGYAGQGGWNTMQQAPMNGFGIAGMVLGIISVVIFCAWGIGIILGILALIFGILGRKRANRGEANNGGMALAGIILGSIGIVIGAVVLGFIIWAIATDADSDDDPFSDTYQTSISLTLTR
ncbi:DUF4190 domain-containing protein [Streptomyces sp. NBC_01465]|uniref:DUF4190 domain-containing protein n=1 Tax=Streptomyces sp. NBC_01465 TaxID=2903878 RepID=UPI002E339D37|nr:DUF4190 domain-containing protein [Streptomyces sp. NBC_01465]